MPPEHLEDGKVGLAWQDDAPDLRGMRSKEHLFYDLRFKVLGSGFGIRG